MEELFYIIKDPGGLKVGVYPNYQRVLILFSPYYDKQLNMDKQNYLRVVLEETDLIYR